MSFEVKTLAVFEKQAKRLLQKFPSLKAELTTLIGSLAMNPAQGTALNRNCYKIRLAIHSKGKGKSGGARVITHVQIIKSTVFLLNIYDKSEQSNLTDKELKSLLDDLPG